MMKETCQSLAARIQDFSSQHIAVTLWAIAKLAYTPSKEVLDTAAARAVELMPEYNPQNIANTLWAYATLGKHPGIQLLDVSAVRAVELMSASFPPSLAQQR